MREARVQKPSGRSFVKWACKKAISSFLLVETGAGPGHLLLPIESCCPPHSRKNIELAPHKFFLTKPYGLSSCSYRQPRNLMSTNIFPSSFQVWVLNDRPVIKTASLNYSCSYLRRLPSSERVSQAIKDFRGFFLFGFVFLYLFVFRQSLRS